MVSLQNTSWEKPAVLAYIGQTEFCYILIFWTTTVDVTKALTQGPIFENDVTWEINNCSFYTLFKCI